MCLIEAKDSDLRWFYKLAKGIVLDFMTSDFCIPFFHLNFVTLVRIKIFVMCGLGSRLGFV